jgi:integrase
MENEHVNSNPTEGVAFVERPTGEGFAPWDESDVELFERCWPVGTRERLVFDLFQFTGLRRGDVARLGRQHVRDGVISLDTEKTGVRVSIPLVAQLAHSIANSPTGDLAFVQMRKESLGNFFRDACRAAGISKSAHGLRKLAATRLANAGASVSELQAWFAWTDSRMPSHYTRSADRQKLAKSALAKLTQNK